MDDLHNVLDSAYAKNSAIFFVGLIEHKNKFPLELRNSGGKLIAQSEGVMWIGSPSHVTPRSKDLGVYASYIYEHLRKIRAEAYLTLHFDGQKYEINPYFGESHNALTGFYAVKTK